MHRIAIIGVGSMGSAVARGLIRTYGSKNIALADRHPEKMKGLDASFATTDVDAAIKNADVIVLAVKPQAFPALMKEIHTPLETKLVISIMAGVGLKDVQEKTGSPRLIRAMPNLALAVGRGLTAWIASADASPDDRETAAALFSALGRSMELHEESQIDAFTALAGSGPAYFFLLADYLRAEALKRGFDEKVSEWISRETLIGSAMLLDSGSVSATEWLDCIASKGGTTEAALKSLKDAHFHEIFGTAIDAAEERSRTLSST